MQQPYTCPPTPFQEAINVVLPVAGVYGRRFYGHVYHCHESSAYRRGAMTTMALSGVHTVTFSDR